MDLTFWPSSPAELSGFLPGTSGAGSVPANFIVETSSRVVQGRFAIPGAANVPMFGSLFRLLVHQKTGRRAGARSSLMNATPTRGVSRFPRSFHQIARVPPLLLNQGHKLIEVVRIEAQRNPQLRGLVGSHEQVRHQDPVAERLPRHPALGKGPGHVLVFGGVAVGVGLVA